MDNNGDSKKKPPKNPWSRANPLSILLFAWILPLLSRGTKKDLTQDDIYQTPGIYESEKLAKKFQTLWAKEEKATVSKGRQPQLYRVLLRLCRRNLIVYFLVLGFDELVIRILQPMTLRMLVKSFEPSSDISRRDQIIYGAALCACTFIHNFVMEHGVFLMLRTGLMCRVACSSILYQKILKLSPFVRKDATTGKMMNLMTNDLGRFDLGFIYLAYILLSPLQAAIFIYFLWVEIGTGTLGGVAVILIVIPLQVLNGHWTAKFRENIAKQTDERSRIMNETILAIKVIKMMAWENPFAQLVHKIRRAEMKALGKKMYLKGFYLAMFTVCIKLTPFLSVMMYVLLDNEITADKAFFTVAVFQIIIECMVYYFSIAIASVGEVWISIRRIQKVLLMDEQTENPALLPRGDQAEDSATPSTTKIVLTNASASWTPGEKPAIADFNLNLEGDKLVMVVGAVGSGKSSFLHALVNELPLSSGSYHASGSITYTSQEPWLFAGTVRENILFGKDYDKQLYHDVVYASALADDFAQLPNGENSLVGERGMSLSGGQKARVNLARALYRDSDIILLDDPLSAVDSRVSRHIFEKCVKSHLRGRLRILATHQLQYLPFADHVVVLKNGAILAQGSPEEIQALNIDLIRLISDEGNSEERRRSSAAITQDAKEAEDSSGLDVEEEEESLNEWKVDWGTYWRYIRSGDSILALIAIAFLYLLGQVSVTLTDFSLSIWTGAEENRQNANKSDVEDLENVFDFLDTSHYYGKGLYLAVYGGLIGVVICVALTRAYVTFTYFLRISVNLHNKMFNSLIRAPAKFFDDNPSGRIMNRFTKDIGSIDELLPGDLYDSLEYLLYCAGVVVVVVASNYYLAIPSFIIIAVTLVIRHLFIKPSRNLKRLEAQARSPVLSHLAASIQGITTIRALHTQTDAVHKFNQLQDIHTAPWFLFLASIRWFTVWIGTIAAIYLTAVTVTFLVITGNGTGGVIGFVIASSIMFTTNLQWSLREAAEADNNMTCAARALEYTTLEPEASWESSSPPPSSWPSSGHIKFSHVYLAYGDTDVLKDLSFEIAPKEKIGIVGRTGAGKSTIIAALFRITEPRGEIYIDDIKINDIGLHELRKNISIIPQDPVLFSGTIRYNLDPFGQYTDPEVWSVLTEVQLNEEVTALDALVEDGGANFSIGQRQLICLARAILRKNRIIVMDEATANVDPKTDAFIQATIRDKFRDCSIITIAHRLQSVMDCDKILVLEKGSMKEYNHPHLLLQNPQGFLHHLVSFVGESGSAQLKEIAKTHYEKNYTNQT